MLVRHLLHTAICIPLAICLLSSCKETTNPPSTADFCDQVRRTDSMSLSVLLDPYKNSLRTKSGVFVLEEGGGSLTTRAWLTEYAETSIDIQYFIFSLDNVGLIACDYLVRAADRGVKVRILVDDFMIEAEEADIQKLAAHENIDIKVYNPGSNLGKNLWNKVYNLVTDFRGFNQRMHNKTFVVDGKVVITGGRNIADEYYDYDHEYNFRDRDVLLLGQVTESVGASFEEYWNHPLSVTTANIIGSIPPIPSGSDAYDALHAYACNPENYWPQIREQVENFPYLVQAMANSGRLHWIDHVQYVSDKPGKNDKRRGLGGGGATTQALIDLVSNATTSILIQTPYLITSDSTKELFRKAVDRGVNIRIHTNSLASTDNIEAFASYQKDRQKLLATGVQVFECKPDAEIRKSVMAADLQEAVDYTPIFGLHAKSMILDDSITVIGTFNLDPRSANLNTECITIIHSEAVAQSVKDGIEKELLPENAWQITRSSNPDKEVSTSKRVQTWTRRILPKGVL